MFRNHNKNAARARKTQDRHRRPVVEGLESRTVLSTMHITPAAEVHVLSAARFAQATIGGTVALPVSVSGTLTLNNFSVTNNQLTATGSLNVGGVATPVAFNANVTQSGTAAPVMTLTPTTTSLNVGGLGTINLNTQAPITVGAGSGLSTLLGNVVSSVGGVTNLSGIASGLNTGLTSSNNMLTNFTVNGTLGATAGVQRFVIQNGQLAAQVSINGNTQITLPLSTSASAGGGLALSTGAGSAIGLGTTGVQLQTGQTINLPVNGNSGRIRQAARIIRNIEAIANFNPRLENHLVNALNRIVRPFTGQTSQATPLIGGTVALPVSVSGTLTLNNFSATNNQLTATGSLNVGGVATPVAFNANVTQSGTAAPVMTLTPTTTSLNVGGLGTVNLNTQAPITVGAGSGLSTLLGNVVSSVGGVTNLSGIASGLNTGLTSSNNMLTNFTVNGTLGATAGVQRFVIQNGQLAAQVSVNGNTQITLPVDMSAQGGGNLVLRTGTGSPITLGSTGVQLQSGQSINLPINGTPGPGNLVVNLLTQLERQPRRLNRIIGQLNQRLALWARQFS